jgi:hypothetical protein
MVWMVVSFMVPQGGRTVELLAGRATWDKTGRKLGGGLRKKTGRTKETWFLSEVQHDLDILLFKHMDVHDPFRSKSSEIQLKKSNWIWIIPNPIPGLASPLQLGPHAKAEPLAYLKLPPPRGRPSQNSSRP